MLQRIVPHIASNVEASAFAVRPDESVSKIREIFIQKEFMLEEILCILCLPFCDRAERIVLDERNIS